MQDDRMELQRHRGQTRRSRILRRDWKVELLDSSAFVPTDPGPSILGPGILISGPDAHLSSLGRSGDRDGNSTGRPLSEMTAVLGLKGVKQGGSLLYHEGPLPWVSGGGGEANFMR